MTFVHAAKAEDFIPTLEDGSVDLLLTDPPYGGITTDGWDNQWPTERAFAEWLSAILLRALPKLTPTGSLVFFSALGRHGSHPLFRVVTALEDGGIHLEEPHHLEEAPGLRQVPRLPVREGRDRVDVPVTRAHRGDVQQAVPGREAGLRGVLED